MALDVVVVSFRSAALLRQCLASLRAHPPRATMRVHVVDNDSRDGTATMVEREFPEVALTRAGRNLGFAAANNLAIARTDAAFILVLNPDTEVTDGALDRLLGVMSSHPEVGICGPYLERPDGGFDHAARRSFPTPVSALGHFTGVGRRLDRGALAAYRAPEVGAGPVDAVNGACMLIRRAALGQVGLFDEGYWMYMEDLDLCFRFAEAGWVTWYEPQATVVHVKAGTSGPIRGPRLNYAFHYGMFRFYRKHYAPRRGALTNAVVYAGIAGKLVLSTARAAVRALVRRAREDPRLGSRRRAAQ